MLYIGDTVKVIGTTNCGGYEKECIVIGTICEVVAVDYDSPSGFLTVGIVPKNELPYDGYSEYWYREKDIQKGHLKWVVEDNKEIELEQ